MSSVGKEIMTVMLSSQGIGLITVIAVSGCSVMLLVLGRQKLLEAKKEVNSVENPKEQELGALGSLSCVDSLKSFSSLPPKGLISWRINFDMAQASAEFQKSSSTMPKSACKVSCKPSSDKKGNPVKKVRFSDDVVEPSGDNAEYRKRHTLAIRSGQMRSTHAQDSQTMNSNNNCSEKKRTPNGECRMQTLGKPSMPPNRRALYNGMCHDRAQRSLLY